MSLEKRKDFLPYGLPCHDGDELKGVTEAIESNWWSRGPKVSEFEEKFASIVGAKYALAVNSCTAALHLALLSHGVGQGDEVITTPYTFCSTVNTIVHTGATPVFADIDPDTGLISPEEIEKKITPKTKGIIPVHYAGQACDMDKINGIAEKNGLFVVEDAAHAVCATYKGTPVGGGHNATAFSFYATKNLSTGEGGMLTSDDEEFISRARVMSLHGMSRNAWNRYSKGGSWRYEVQYAGHKYNMTDIAAALGLAQLDKLDAMQSLREEYAYIYGRAFEGVKGVEPLKISDMGRHAWHLYAIRIKSDELSIGRDEFARIMTEDYNIGISVHFIPVHLHPFYVNNYNTCRGQYPNAEKLFDEELSIPLYPAMTKDDVEYVAKAVREIAAQHAK